MENKIYNTEKIRIAMAKRAITAEKLSELSGLNKNTVTKVLAGKPVYILTLKAVADALEINWSELFTPTEQEQEKQAA